MTFELAVADPAFSPGGAPTPKNAIIFQFFTENCMKMKEFGPPGGARVPGTPPWIHQWLVMPFMKTGIPEPLWELCVLHIRLQKSNKSTLWQFLTLLILNNFYFSLMYIVHGSKCYNKNKFFNQLKFINIFKKINKLDKHSNFGRGMMNGIFLKISIT